MRGSVRRGRDGHSGVALAAHWQGFPERKEEIVANSNITHFFPLKTLNPAWCRSFLLVSVPKLTLIVLTPCVQLALHRCERSNTCSCHLQIPYF